MGKKLSILLPDGWLDISEPNPAGMLTMCWDNPAAQGAFQISTAEYTGGNEPHSSEPELVQSAVSFGERHRWGNLARSSSGKCVMGLFGTAVFNRIETMPPDEPAVSQVWFITNGLDFVLATFIAMGVPEERECHDAQRIAEGVDFR